MTRQESLADLVRKMPAKDGGMVKILMWEGRAGGGKRVGWSEIRRRNSAAQRAGAELAASLVSPGSPQLPRTQPLPALGRSEKPRLRTLLARRERCMQTCVRVPTQPGGCTQREPHTEDTFFWTIHLLCSTSQVNTLWPSHSLSVMVSML